MKYFAYRYTSGGIKVKMYDAIFGKEDLDAAMESDFTDEVTTVYEAENREQAEQIAKAKLGNNPTLGTTNG